MDHVAIMKSSWKLIEKIISSEKTMESRWYQARRTPWNAISAGDRIFFKDSGKPISATAEVSSVLFFELKSLADARSLVAKYGKELCLVNTNVETWGFVPKYCILIQLKNAKTIEPFHISKKGFGSAAAWITIQNIALIRL